MTENTTIIGSSPSSGSTLLADLLDSTSCASCGPELNLFSHKYLYDFPKYKKNLHRPSPTDYFCRASILPYYHRLPYYGLRFSDYETMINSSKNLNSFINTFRSYYLNLRGKDTDDILFEKTPENTGCLEEILKKTKYSFIFVLRNPLYTYISMRKRGFRKYVAALTLLVNIGKYLNHKENDRVMLVKYENLVKKPFYVTSRILKSLGKDEKQAQIKRNYQNNIYRKLVVKRIDSWNIKKMGQIKSANIKPLNSTYVGEFKYLLDVKLTADFSKLLNTQQITFSDAVKELGYIDYIYQKTSNVKPDSTVLKRTKEDWSLLYTKWKLTTNDRFKAANAYLRPTEIVK